MKSEPKILELEGKIEGAIYVGIRPSSVVEALRKAAGGTSGRGGRTCSRRRRSLNSKVRDYLARESQLVRASREIHSGLSRVRGRNFRCVQRSLSNTGRAPS